MESAQPLEAPPEPSHRVESSCVHSDFDRLRSHLEQCIVGQANLVEKLLVCLLADGHLLVEGAPGLAKTKAVKTLADAIECGG